MKSFFPISKRKYKKARYDSFKDLTSHYRNRKKFDIHLYIKIWYIIFAIKMFQIIITFVFGSLATRSYDDMNLLRRQVNLPYASSASSFHFGRRYYEKPAVYIIVNYQNDIIMRLNDVSDYEYIYQKKRIRSKLKELLNEIYDHRRVVIIADAEVKMNVMSIIISAINTEAIGNRIKVIFRTNRYLYKKRRQLQRPMHPNREW